MMILSRAGRLASGWSLREGDDASSSGRLADWVGWGEVDMLSQVWILHVSEKSRGIECQLNYRFVIYTLGVFERKRAGVVVGSGMELDLGRGRTFEVKLESGSMK